MQNVLSGAGLAKAIAKEIGVALVADQGVALRIRYVGSPESSEDYADAVLVSATSLTLSINGSADDTVGSSGVLAFATYTTLGTLVDAINASANWEAEIVGGDRADTTDSSELLARSTSTFRPWKEIKLFWDSSAASKITYAFEPGQPFDSLRSPDRLRLHRVGLTRILALVNTSDSGTWDCTVYEVPPSKLNAEVKTLADYDTADNTALDTGALEEPYVHADYGNTILVEVYDGSWADSGAYLKAYGKRQ